MTRSSAVQSLPAAHRFSATVTSSPWRSGSSATVNRALASIWSDSPNWVKLLDPTVAASWSR